MIFNKISIVWVFQNFIFSQVLFFDFPSKSKEKKVSDCKFIHFSEVLLISDYLSKPTHLNRIFFSFYLVVFLYLFVSSFVFVRNKIEKKFNICLISQYWKSASLDWYHLSIYSAKLKFFRTKGKVFLAK